MQVIAVVTHADVNVREMCEFTHPFIIDYAKNCGAEYLNMDHQCDIPHAYRILMLHELLDKYDRILNIDSDILINPNCPNIFDEVPDDSIGTIFEDKGSRMGDRRKRMKLAQEKFGDVGWKSGYINTGVFLVSRMHKPIFQKINGELWNDLGYDDVHLGWQIRKYGFKIHELHYKFNHMSMFSENWNGNADRFRSHIIHYAGQGKFDCPTKMIQIKNDIERLAKMNSPYK